MDMPASATDALGALRTSLQSDRDWRNIQKTVALSIHRLSVVASAQQQQLDAIQSRLTALETTRKDDDARAKTLRQEIARELKAAMMTNHDQLTQRVCAHVDARVAAQRSETDEQRRVDACRRRDETTALRQELTDKIATLQTARAQLRDEDDTKLHGLDRRLTRLEQQLRTTETAFTSRWTAWRDDLTQTLEQKASQHELTAVRDAQTQELASVRAAIETAGVVTEQATDSRVGDELTQLKANLHELVGIVEALQTEQTMLKALTIDHVQNDACIQSSRASDDRNCTGDDTKRAVRKLHDAVTSVRRSVESVAKRAEVEALSEQVTWLRKQLRSEIYQARYIWKEGRPTASQTIAWSAQIVNTNSDVFVWQRSRGDAVTTMVPGLYHLQAAFFTRFEPVLQVLVNGEPALITTTTTTMTSKPTDDATATNSDRENASGVLNQARPVALRPAVVDTGPHRRRLHHSAGDLVGVEISAFLALPARAVVTIGYDIVECAQGFLNLRKL